MGLGVQNKTGQRLTEFCQENTLVIANTLFNNTREEETNFLYEHHQMVNTMIRLITFLQPKMEKLYIVRKKKDRELAVAQIMNFLLLNLDLS